MNSKTGWVAGINHGAHDASCALLYDGELVVTVEQERLSRIKRAVDQSPAEALRFCMEFAGIRLSDVDTVALGSDHDALARWMGLASTERERVLPFDRPGWLFPDDIFQGERPGAVQSVPHHLAHAASAFWPSGFDECAVLVIDAMGEDTGTSIAAGGADGLKSLETYPVDTSLGFFYEAASEFAGLGRQDGGKLMGLAAYGAAKYPGALCYRDNNLVWDGVPEATANGRALIEQRSKELQRYFAENCYPYACRRGESVMAYADFAASAQWALEETVLDLAKRARDLTGASKLALAGGVGLNCTANGKLAESGIFDEVYIQPMAHDTGVALGAALMVAAEKQTRVHKMSCMPHARWGPDLADEDIEAAFAAADIKAERLEWETLIPKVAKILASGGIVAWGQGRAEVGPRALGARSLLADPRDRENLTRLNSAKNREMWRPLAPSVPEDRFGEFFHGVPNPFMIVAAQVRGEMRRRIPAVVHVDGSARPQAVNREQNFTYHALLSEFDKHVGVPVLVNTSLNVAEEPMASSSEDIVNTFRKSGADAVVIGNYVALRD